MKKRILRLSTLLSLMIITVFLSSCGKDYSFAASKASADSGSVPLCRIIDPDSEVRGIWIASVFNIDFPSRTDLTAAEMKSEIDSIISTCKASGLNTVYFQVRPECDALYVSDIFPVSKYLSTNGELVFDPLDYFVREAHENNMFLYAWVNPLRVASVATDTASLPPASPAALHPEWVREYDGRLYFDAGIPQVRTLVADGVKEIVARYDVDGVVFDDYFYPYPVYDEKWQKIGFGDDDTFAEYCVNFTNVEEWRRENINQLVKACCEAVHSADEECLFGVAPFGVWQNDNGENGGSATANLESYSALYCDTLAWAEGGYVDFISPQLYWDFDTASSPFDVILRWWNAALDGTGVELTVSHALHNYDGVWEYPEGHIAEQIAFARSEKLYSGSVCYGYSVLRNNIHGAADELARIFSDEIVYTAPASNGFGVEFSSPVSGSVTYSGKTYVIGSCDPAFPLTVDGKPVSMTKSGYFNLFLTLDEGENVFVFAQNGKEYEYKITYSTTYEQTEESAGVFSPSVDVIGAYPTSDVATSDDCTWVQCYAPLGSTVTATVGGIETELKLISEPKGSGKGYACALYGGEAKLPSSPDGLVTDCGSLYIKVSHRDGEAVKECANVRVLGKDARLTVRAKADYTELKITENSLYYNDYTVQSKGMTDYADSLGDGFYHLRMGGYVYADSVSEVDTTLHDKCKIKSVDVRDDGKRTSIVIEADDCLPYNGSVDGGCFVLTLYNADSESAPDAQIGKNPFFDSCTVVRLDGKVRYSFPLYDTDNFYGFDLEYGDGTINVTLKDPISVDLDSDKPLCGIVIVLDAGHGGEECGALGTGGAARKDEKDLNLDVVLACAERLTALGAEVRLTRDSDTTFYLNGKNGRVKYLEENEPDLCISIHQNSDDYSHDVTGIRGTLGLWCMDGGAMLSECVSKAVARSLSRLWQDSRYQMLAMCRNPKFPAALIEVGFMTSVEEYELMTSPRGVKMAADGVVDGVLEWFRRQEKFASVG